MISAVAVTIVLASIGGVRLAAVCGVIIIVVVASMWTIDRGSRRRFPGGLVRLEESAIVPFTCEDVWNVIKPAEQAPLLDPSIRLGYRIPGTPHGIGEQQAFERHDGSVVTIEVIEYTEFRRAVTEQVSPRSTEQSRTIETVEPVDGGCTYAVAFEIGLPAGRHVQQGFEQAWRDGMRKRIAAIHHVLTSAGRHGTPMVE